MCKREHFCGYTTEAEKVSTTCNLGFYGCYNRALGTQGCNAEQDTHSRMRFPIEDKSISTIIIIYESRT